MGVLSDFFIATQADAPSYDGVAKFPSGEFVQFKWLTPLEVAGLWAVLSGAPDRLELTDKFELIHEPTEEGPWICRVPDDLVTRLAECPESQFAPVAADWAAVTTEELGWALADFEEIIEDLAALATAAKARGKNMYLWNCL